MQSNYAFIFEVVFHWVQISRLVKFISVKFFVEYTILLKFDANFHLLDMYACWSKHTGGFSKPTAERELAQQYLHPSTGTATLSHKAVDDESVL